MGKSENEAAERLRAILRTYSQSAAKFLGETLTPYAGKWRLDFARYRPIEEGGRPARLHARNDLPHVDAFPTRPINPAQNRVWITAQTFGAIAPRLAQAIGLLRRRADNPLRRGVRALARAMRMPGAERSLYDDFMHRCHNAMKEDAGFQENSPKQRWEFPPNSTWMVFTDYVSHAVLEGQYALEQTFIIDRRAMVQPEMSPLAILERLAGYPLTEET